MGASYNYQLTEIIIIVSGVGTGVAGVANLCERQKSNNYAVLMKQLFQLSWSS